MHQIPRILPGNLVLTAITSSDQSGYHELLVLCRNEMRKGKLNEGLYLIMEIKG